MIEYRFWGLREGKRELFGMAKNVSGMSEALSVLAAFPRERFNYTGLEIERVVPQEARKEAAMSLTRIISIKERIAMSSEWKPDERDFILDCINGAIRQ